MTLDFVPFEDLDKNKWNGNIHYSVNGNIYGYYWYLKSVIKEWDAIIEGDYQSVMPIPRRPLSEFQKSLLPYLGPYTVLGIYDKRVQSFYSKWKLLNRECYYGFNDSFGKLIANEDQRLVVKKRSYIDLNSNYELITEGYHNEANQVLIEATTKTFVFGSDIKPELLLAEENMSELEKNTYYRIMYNAIQRSAGWGLLIEDKNSGKFSKSFFINDKSGIYEIFTSTQNTPNIHLSLIDTLLRSNAGKPMNLFLHPLNENINTLLGGESLKYFVAETSKMNFYTKLKSFFGVKLA